MVLGKREVGILAFLTFLLCFMVYHGAKKLAVHRQCGDLYDRIMPIIYDQAVEQNILGTSVAVILNDKSCYFNVGVKSLSEPKTPVTKDTIYELGSVTKTFTALAAGLLAEEEKINLLNPLRIIFPEFAGTDIGRVNTRSLLIHGSGLSLGMPVQGAERPTEDEWLTYLQNWKNPGVIDRERVYSNLGIDLVTKVIASKTGSYFDFVRGKILEPIDMENTFFVIPENKCNQMATGYTDTSTEKNLENTAAWWSGSTGLKSTSEDLLKYVKAYLGYLPSAKQEVDEGMARTLNPYAVTPLYTQALVWEEYDMPLDARKFLMANSNKAQPLPLKVYAKGPPAFEHETLVSTTGMTEGFSAYIGFLVKEKVGLVMLTNRAYPTQVKAFTVEKIFNELVRAKQEMS